MPVLAIPAPTDGHVRHRLPGRHRHRSSSTRRLAPRTDHGPPSCTSWLGSLPERFRVARTWAARGALRMAGSGKTTAARRSARTVCGLAPSGATLATADPDTEPCAVYFPSCVTRDPGTCRMEPRERHRWPRLLIEVSPHAQEIHCWIPESITWGHCCGMSFSSKGLRGGPRGRR